MSCDKNVSHKGLDASPISVWQNFSQDYVVLGSLNALSYLAGNEVAGKISLKHVYEIAKIKSEDPSMDGYSLEEVCRFVINVARTCGIEVVKSLDPAEYRAFLDERKNIVAEQDRQFEEIRQARLLRI